MKVSPRSAPLEPAELRRVRALLARCERGEVLEEHLAPAEVASRVRLNRRTVLNLCGKADGFPNASKPFPNTVRIPASDVVAFLHRHAVRSAEGEADE